MREVVSVQLGGYANYAGAHFWNLQDEALAAAAAVTPVRAERRQVAPL